MASPDPHSNLSTSEGGLNLRVSVATLVRVVFNHPQSGETMLALERKAAVVSKTGTPQVRVWAQPFGGAIQFRSLAPLQNLIGSFDFDSERSRSESDFRILIRPTDWSTVRQFCLEQFQASHSVLDSDPARELEEEFADSLAIQLKPHHYTQRPVAILAEDTPAPTGNSRAQGHDTVRLYRIFEVRIVDPALALTMLSNSERHADADLREQALADLRQGGRGRANAVLAVPLVPLTESYMALSPQARLHPHNINNHQLDVTVTVVLEGVPVPIYRVL